MTDMLEKVARVICEVRRQYAVQGTPADPTKAYGPPWKAPWFVIDVSKAEPEVGWPGELVAEYDDPLKAHDHLGRLVAKAAIETTRESILMAVRRACEICESNRPIDDDTCPYCGSIVEAIKAALEGKGMSKRNDHIVAYQNGFELGHECGWMEGHEEGERMGWEKGIKAASKVIRQASFPIGPAYADNILKLVKP